MANSFKCQVCSATELEIFEQFRTLPRVTSDSKPWPAGGDLSVCHGCGAIQKLLTEKWRSDAASIYRNYEMYHLSRGAEQLVFADTGAIKPRSERLVEFVLGKLPPVEHGKLIDIGCGNGEALRNFSRALPQWKLYGNELNEKALAELRLLPNFVQLYTVPPPQIRERFTVVSMVHALEHMPTPLALTTEAADLLDKGGVLFVEVPDIETSPFDVLVADHMMHFSRASLGALAARAGISVMTLANDVLPKEITLIGRRAKPAIIASDPEAGIRLARSIVTWLVNLVAEVRDLARQGEIGIFGTSVAGMALYGEFRDRVAFFVDEDPARIGKSYDGRPVIAPNEAPGGTPVVMALPPERAKRAAERLAATGMRAICPPPLPA
jgi:SAM-dependent methyltransferase